MTTKWEDVADEFIDALDVEVTEDKEEDMGKKGGLMAPDDEDLLKVVKDMPLIEEIRRFLSISKVKRAFALGTELFNAATPFLDKPSWWTAGKAAFAMGKTMIEDVEVYSEDYFAGDEWTEPYSQDFTQTLLHVLQKFPYERIKTSEDNTFIRVCTLPNGLKVGWTYTGRLQTVDNIYVETERMQEAKDYIKQLLWEQFQGKSLVMRKNNRLILKENEARVIFEQDDAFESKQSKRATEYARYLKKPIAAGVPRTVMFYGPPGTGKSTMARTIVELMGFRSFRIRIADLGQLDNSTLFEALNIFQPDAVILDDFDRTHHQAQLLETLEYFQEKVKLVIITVNNRRKLDDALQRPGRIDEIELVDTLDEEVVRHVLGEYNDGYDYVKDWPIAFIHEYVVRRTYLSPEEAAESVKELAKRVKGLSKYRDEDDDGMARMWSLIGRAAKVNAAVNTTVPGEASPPADQGDESEITPDQLKDAIDTFQREMGLPLGEEDDVEDDDPLDPEEGEEDSGS
jgi:DNA replication protein DnaC